jgi:diguanylate cyclase (GGDEF)-like protein
MADLDRFKPYNDTYGHLAGDALLSKFGSILHRSLRTVDVAARYGGDEFVILLPDQELTGAVEVAERIRQRIAEETGDPMTGRPPITASFGIATFPAAGRTPEQLLASADRALYEAKHSGRNGVRIAASSQPDP